MIAILLGGWGLLKPNGLQADESVSVDASEIQTDIMTRPLLLEERAATDWAYFGEGTGPFGGGSDTRWKNATEGEMIPAEYSFAVSQMEDSENPENSTYIMDVSSGITEMAQELGYTTPYLVNPKGKEIYAAPAQHPSKPDDDPMSFAKVAVAFPTSSGEAQWMKLANVGYYGGERLNVKITVKPGQSVPNNRLMWIGWQSSQFLETYFDKSIGFLDVSFEFFTLSDSGAEIPTAITGNWPMYLRYPQTEVSVLSPTVSNIINVYSVSPTAPSLPLLMPYRINENSQLELSSKPVPMEEFENTIYTTQTCAVLTFKNSQNISYRIAPLSTYTFFRLSVMYNFQPPVASEVPAPEAKDHVVPTIYDFSQSQSDLYLEFNQFIPFEPVNFRDQLLKWEIVQQSVDTPVEYDSGTWENGWEVKNNQQVDSKNLFDFDFETGNGKIFETGDGKITLKSNQSTVLFQASSNYLFKQKMKINYKKRIDSTLLRKVNEPNNTDGYYLPRQAKATLSGRKVPPATQEQEEVGTNYTTWINFAANVEYQRYAIAPDGTETLIDAINTADSDTLTTLGITQPLITHEAPIPTKVPTGYIQAKKADGSDVDPVYEIPQVDKTVNNPKQLQLTGKTGENAPDEDKNIVKLYYRSMTTPYDVSVKVVGDEQGTNVLSDNAITYFTISPAPADGKLKADTEYKITQQTDGIVKAGYTVASGEAKFAVTIDGMGKYSVEEKTPKNPDYSFAINPDTGELTITVVNLPGSYSLVSADELTFGNHKLPNPTLPVEIFPTKDWSLTYINNDPTADKLQIKVTATPFKNETSELDGLLYFKKEDTDEPISINTAEQTLYNYTELKELSPNEKIKKTSDGAGFFLKGENIHNAYKAGKIPAGNTDYTAEITFTIANDAE